jgi:hypothetical protein
MTAYEYADHPLAAMFPLIEGEEFDTLAVSIRKQGTSSTRLHATKA